MKILGSISVKESIVSKDYVDNGLDGKVDKTDARLYDARTPLSHTQAISTIIGLQAKLDEMQSTIDALQTALDNKVDKGTTVTIVAGQVKL